MHTAHEIYIFTFILDDIIYEVQYKAYIPDPTTMTLMHTGTPLIKYMYGLGSAFGIVVTLAAVNTVAELRSTLVTINVPVRSAGNLSCRHRMQHVCFIALLFQSVCQGIRLARYLITMFYSLLPRCPFMS